MSEKFGFRGQRERGVGELRLNAMIIIYHFSFCLTSVLASVLASVLLSTTHSAILI